MSGNPIRVLVVDDSPTVRHLLRGILESDPAITVVGEAADGAQAVEQAVRLAPDIITMDINMPVMDGLEATREIMTAAPTPIVVVSTTVSRNDVGHSFDATQAGALMVVTKPEGPRSEGFAEESGQLVAMVKAMAQVKVVRRWGPRRMAQRPWTAARADAAVPGGTSHRPAAEGATRSVVAIGTSTGGPAALHRILGELPREFALPIVVVQHIAKGFVGGLASWLDAATALRVKVAEDGEELVSGTVYLAPDDHHLGLRGGRRVFLSAEPPIGGFRPSATFLFASVAQAVGANTIALVLTGMGSDGVAGLVDVRKAGGRVLAQDEKSSVVFGMAQEAVREGVVDAIVPLDGMVPRLLDLVA